MFPLTLICLNSLARKLSISLLLTFPTSEGYRTSLNCFKIDLPLLPFLLHSADSPRHFTLFCLMTFLLHESLSIVHLLFHLTWSNFYFSASMLVKHCQLSFFFFSTIVFFPPAPRDPEPLPQLRCWPRLTVRACYCRFQSLPFFFVRSSDSVQVSIAPSPWALIGYLVSRSSLYLSLWVSLLSPFTFLFSKRLLCTSPHGFELCPIKSVFRTANNSLGIWSASTTLSYVDVYPFVAWLCHLQNTSCHCAEFPAVLAAWAVGRPPCGP